MARLIVKSPYINCGSGGGSVGGYMKYIATRERVEKIADDRPPTKGQEKLTQSLLRDFPDAKSSEEYKSYEETPTRATASDFITATLEEHFETAQRSEKYLRYIATRPRAERIGSHGLFGDEDHIDLEQKISELEAYNGKVWTHIISLKREDAARLGYDNAGSWRNLLRSHRNEIAEAMNIPADHFRWYAAFHDEGEHPHVHMMAWSKVEGEGYLNKDGIRQIRSKLTNDMFRHEMLHLYEQKSQSRDELVREARKTMLELSRKMQNSVCNHPRAEELITELSQRLEYVSGKKSYGYLPKQDKRLVDEIVDEMAKLPTVQKCYERWRELQHQVESYYHDRPEKFVPLPQQKEFRAVKNAVIHEAERLRQGEVGFEDGAMRNEDEPDHEEDVSWDYLNLKEAFEDEDATVADKDELIEAMTDLANRGDADMQYYLGKLWRGGPQPTPDWVNARYWLTQSARQEYSPAQCSLAKLYLSSDIEVRDPKKGVQWLEAAAENGNDYAAYRLGKEYLKGKIVEKDIAKAIDCFTQAAEQGNSYAQYMLGKLYLDGREFPADKGLGEYWLSQAAEQGHEYAGWLLNRQGDQTPSVMLAVTRLLHHMSRIFHDNIPPPEQPREPQVDRKLRRKLQEKKQALGIKSEGHSKGMTMG